MSNYNTLVYRIQPAELQTKDAVVSCKKYYWVWKWKWLFDSVDIEECLLQKPEVREYHKRHILNTWTVEDPSHMKENKALADAQTFQLIGPELVKEIMAK